MKKVLYTLTLIIATWGVVCGQTINNAGNTKNDSVLRSNKISPGAPVLSNTGAKIEDHNKGIKANSNSLDTKVNNTISNKISDSAREVKKP
jgi:hypothetical protein